MSTVVDYLRSDNERLRRENRDAFLTLVAIIHSAGGRVDVPAATLADVALDDAWQISRFDDLDHRVVAYEARRTDQSAPPP